MRILVAYATRAGSTRGVALAIADELRSDGDEVTVAPARSTSDVRGYDGVVIGSAIRERRWLDDATSFIEANAEDLSRTPVAYFAVALTTLHRSPRTEKEAERYSRYPVGRFPEVSPVAVAVFTGALDNAQLTPGERLFVKAFRVAPGDYRDWEAIRAWARRVHSEFAQRRAPVTAGAIDSPIPPP